MPTFNNISNGESGLSVRTTLNDVINYVNTGITLDDKYVTGGTYNNGTGTLTLERQNGSVNVTGFLTGFTETQNLTNVLALGNTTGSNNIVVENGQKIESVSGNTSIVVNDGSLNISSTDGNSVANTSLQNNGRITLSSSDGGDLSTIFDMYATSRFDVQSIDNNLGYTSQIELDAPGNVNGNRLYATDETNEVYVSFDGGGTIELNSTDGTYTSTLSIYPNEVNTNVTDGTNSNSISSVEDSNTHLVTDGTDTTTITLQASSLQSSSTDGTNTSSQTITPGDLTFTSTNGTDTGEIILDRKSLTFNTSNTIKGNTSTVNGFFDPSILGGNKVQIEITDITGEISTFGMTSQGFSLNYTDGGSIGNGLLISGPYAVFDVTDGSVNSGFEFDPESSNNGTFIYQYDGLGNSTSVELDPLGSFNGNRLYSTDGTAFGYIQWDYAQSYLENNDGGTNTGYIAIGNQQLDLGVDDGVSSNTIALTSTNLNISNIPAFDDDTAASSLTTGDIYQTTGNGASPLDVAGILMIKQ
jgi:hypothetical protein